MATQAATSAAVVPAPARPRRRRWLQPLVKNPLVLGGLVLVAFFLAVAVLAPVVAPADPIAMNAGQALEGPSLSAPFGTDRFGRDVLSRAIHGTRASLFVGIGSIVIACLIGTVVGFSGTGTRATPDPVA
jgi:peptide/nickel transport system permease protein